MKKTVILGMLIPSILCAGERVMLKSSGVEVLGYQAEPLSNPVGGKWSADKFRADHFIHPLKTPGGFVLTEANPKDHPHHFGLWWPWKYIQNGERKLITWDLQTMQGYVRATESRMEGNTLVAGAEYVDRLAEGGPEVLIKETARIKVSDTVEQPVKGYFLDIEITQTPAVGRPVKIPVYRYSGFSLRGNLFWDKDNSSLLTSDGKKRNDGNGTRARWVRLQGADPDGGEAGVLMMTHPENRSYPEQIRIWDDKWHNGAIFANFNPVMSEPWVLEAGKNYTRKYRLFVYDGEVDPEQADELQKAYAAEK